MSYILNPNLPFLWKNLDYKLQAKLFTVLLDCARTKQGFNNKDAETAIADWLKQAGNSYMKANKK